MAAVTAQGVRDIFKMLNLPPPSNQRIQDIIAKGSSPEQVRDGLIAFMVNKDPNDDLTDPAAVLVKVLDAHFAAAGIEDAAADGQTEAERLQRIAADILAGKRTLGEATSTIAGFGPESGRLDPDEGTTDVDPTKVGNSVIPQGGELIRVRNPKGSDDPYLYYITYQWRGVTMAYEVGGPDRFRELFGSTDNFASFRTVSQNQYDEAGYVEVGSIDQELGATESIGSRIERETRALGLEDMPQWLAGSQDALALVAQATAQEWSSGRLWKELSTTQAFKTRFGTAWQRYQQQNVTIAEAVRQLVADEDSLRNAIRPFGQANTQLLQQMLNQGWTAPAAGQVLETAEILRRDPDSLARSNFILRASGLQTLNEVQFLNALRGVGPQNVIEALNTATAARAMTEAGIDLSDDDARLVMEVVDQSDRLLTADAWRSTVQELALNLARFSHEIDTEKLGANRERIMAAAFGQAYKGESAGETLTLLARLERDRRAASEGFDGGTGFIDDQGRLRIQGLASA